MPAVRSEGSAPRRGRRRKVRRAAHLLVAVVALAVVAAGCTGGHSSQPGRAAQAPNILVIVTDDQRLDEMSAMPKTRGWLARDGVTYTNAISQTPLCCPARASIFTGQYAHNTGVRTLDDAHLVDFDHLLAHELSSAGYQTAIAGKYFNFWDLCNTDPPDFDHFAVMVTGYDKAAFRVDHYTGHSYDNLEYQRPPGSNVANGVCETGDGHGVRAPYSTTYVQHKALDFLGDFSRQPDRPWFLYVAPFAPHAPATPAAKYADAATPRIVHSPAYLERDLSDKSAFIRDTTRGPHVAATSGADPLHRNMYRTLFSVDDMVGAIHDDLARLGELDNTLVLFTSDNGYMLGEEHQLNKREAYSTSVRIPLYASWPGHLMAHSVDPRITALIDLAPTILEAADITPNHVIDGESLLEPGTRKRILVEGFAGGSFYDGESAYAGWWNPHWMYRENAFTTAGGPGCRDESPRTICQPYAGEFGTRELYTPDDPYELANVMQRGATGPTITELHDSLVREERCAGAGCRRLETRPVSISARPMSRVSMSASATARSGVGYPVTVTYRNDASTPARAVELRIEENPHWTVTATSPTRFTDVAPGRTVRATWVVRFDGTGRIFLSAEAVAQTDRGLSYPWAVHTVVVR